jgi:chemosensory pili system protein ChpA (sensor histidine kinase/response regulator)
MTVLVVSDDAQLRCAMQSCLEQNRLHVEVTGDYLGAVDCLSRMSPQLVCIDWALQGESAVELCEHIRVTDRLRNVPILVVSSIVSQPILARAEGAGVNAFLKKPFSTDRLMRYVSVLLVGPLPRWPRSA